MHKIRSILSVAALSAVAGLGAGAFLAQAGEPAPPSLLDLPAKQIMATSLIGAAHGLNDRHAVSAPTLARAERLAEGVAPQVRATLSDLEQASYDQAFLGQWSEASLTAYLEVVEMPKSDILVLQVMASGPAGIEADLLDQRIFETRPDIYDNMVKTNALSEMVMIGASLDVALDAMTGPRDLHGSSDPVPAALAGLPVRDWIEAMKGQGPDVYYTPEVTEDPFRATPAAAELSVSQEDPFVRTMTVWTGYGFESRDVPLEPEARPAEPEAGLN